MALVNGDYLTLTDRIVADLKTDIGAGGLWENLGTFDAIFGGGVRRSVNSIEREMKDEVTLYDDLQLPAIVILPTARDSEEEEHPQHFHKTFRLTASILARNEDFEAADSEMLKVVHRLEKYIRDQNSTDQLFGIQENDIDGQDEKAGIVVALSGTTMVRARNSPLPGIHSMAEVDFVIEIPVQFEYT